MRARQHTNLRHDGTHGSHVATIDAAPGIKNVPAHDLRLDLFKDIGDLLLGMRRVLHPVRTEMSQDLGLGCVERRVALLLVGNRIGGAQILFDQCEHLLLEAPTVRLLQLTRFLRGLLRKPDDGVNHRLEMPVAEHHRAEHEVFGQLLCLGFDHQHRILRAGDDKIELALSHLVELRVEHVLVVDEADARRAERPHEGCARKRERRRRGDHGQNVGVVLEVVRKGCYDHLGLAPPAFCEQRAHRTVDQPRDQRLLLGGAAFALEIAARNAAGRIEFLLVIDGKRQKVEAFPWLLGGDHGRQHLRLAITRHNGAIGLARDLAGL